MAIVTERISYSLFLNLFKIELKLSDRAGPHWFGSPVSRWMEYLEAMKSAVEGVQDQHGQRRELHVMSRARIQGCRGHASS